MKGDVEVILMAATCGPHGKDCASCKSAEKMNNNTITALRAENERLRKEESAHNRNVYRLQQHLGKSHEAADAAKTWLRDCSKWMLTNDLDMQCPMDADPLDIADDIEAALSNKDKADAEN